MPSARSSRFVNALASELPDRPFEVRFWDGAVLPATVADGRVPAFTVQSPQAIADAVWAPGQLGLGRAYVAGRLDVDDLDGLIDLMNNWTPPALSPAAKRQLALAALRAAGPTLPGRRTSAELVPKGRRHSLARDRRAVRHHYDVSNEFFELFLGPSLAYSCAVFSRGARTLEQAQETKLELVCTKLGLQPGERVLDVGCGWGSFALHAAAQHGVNVVGITLSPEQARRATQRVADAGLSGQVEIRVMDYRDLAGEKFDAISSIGMVEHVGSARIDEYAEILARCLHPGGRLLNHGIARLRHDSAEAGAFSERFVFPDGAPLHLSRVQFALERAGFETGFVEGFKDDYATTLTHWIDRLDERLDEARSLAGDDRVRVWRLYLRAARNGFRTGFTSIYQVQATLAGDPPGGASTRTAPAAERTARPHPLRAVRGRPLAPLRRGSRHLRR